MKIYKPVIRIAFGLIIMLSISPIHAYAYSEETHKALNEYISQYNIQFPFNSYLTNTLGFERGIKEKFIKDQEEKEVWQWLGIGGVKEDKPSSDDRQMKDYVCNGSRNMHHFHNPLRHWSEAGLNDDLDIHCSTVIWNPAFMRLV